ncbi:MAG TPA: elongation factor P hydroxylase [Parachlamydiaceae bacterium]|nr:elongation factor P hydroxylase [Parachlamydiaceae bacterium]
MIKENIVHEYQDLIEIFKNCFFEKYNTKLVKGDNEPLYLPADAGRPHNELYFAHGFFASALHETSHWLIAGEKRRKLVDFGYWYAPDGRSIEQQEQFQSVEVKPQAIEWMLSKAAGFRFRVSIDNLDGPESDTVNFKKAVYEQVKMYCQNGLSVRAECFRKALCQFYNTPSQLKIEEFDICSI